MSFTRRPGSERPRQTNHRKDRHIIKNARVQPAASSAVIQLQVSPSLGAPVSSRTIQRRLAEGHLRLRCPLCVLPMTLTHRHLHLKCCRARERKLEVGWNQVIFSDESRFGLSSDDNHVRVGRLPGERLNLAFTLQRHAAPTAGVMVWGFISYNTRLPLVLILGTMTARWYVLDILQPHVLPLMQRLPPPTQELVFNNYNNRPHTARVSQDCHRTVTTLLWPS
ncbi:transposable element Tcb2 transposase [Trichonephila clavipes]|nr:transposable element Tcb2 transposase [Trichonephila clavipes]